MVSCFSAQRSAKKNGFDKQGMRRNKSPLYNQNLHQANLQVGEENNTTLDAPSDNSWRTLSMRLETVVEEKVGGALYSWKKRQLRIDGGHLVCTNIKSKSQKSKMVPLQLCMVRPLGKTRFKVVCATKYSLELRAKHAEAMRDWVNAIQGGIANALSAYNEQSSSAEGNTTGRDLLSALYRANPQNKICADCDAKDPTWASISLGAIVCIECSGVHRSLGTHISKVRSFELDKWHVKTEMIEKMGNADVNSVYERYIPFPREKPTASSDREEREKFIIDKYVNKVFVRSAEAVAEDREDELTSPFTPTITVRLHSSEGVKKPTCHIGSNVFAIKTQYGAISPSFIRRGSLIPTKSNKYNNSSPRSKRRSSMFPQQTKPSTTTPTIIVSESAREGASEGISSPRRNSVFQTQNVRRGSVFQHNQHYTRRNSLYPQAVTPVY